MAGDGILHLMGIAAIEVPAWSIVSVACLTLFYIYGAYPMGTWKRLGVPGPPPIPFLGNAHHLFFVNRCKARANIAKLTEKYGKIMGIHMFRQQCLVVTDLEAVKEIFVTDFSSFNERYSIDDGGSFQKSLKDSLPFQKGDDWKRNKKILSPSFTGSKLRLLTSYMNTTARQLNKKLGELVDAGKMIRAQQVFGAFALDVFTGTAFSFNLDTQNNMDNDYFKNAKKIFHFGAGAKFAMFLVSTFPFLSYIFRRLEISILDGERLEFYRKEARKIVKERKSDPDTCRQADILQLLIDSEVEPGSSDKNGSKRLTSEEVVSHATSFFLGGFETTAMSIQFVSYAIATHPDVQNKLVEEIERVVRVRDDDEEEEEITYELCQNLPYMDAVLHETLRMYTPVGLVTRVAGRNTVLKGVVPVPKGTAIYVYIGNICKDPDVFEDPDTFNPDRFLHSNVGDDDKPDSTSSYSSVKSIACLPFGVGPRQCLGMRLSLLEIKIALVHMLKKFRFVEASPRDLVLEDLAMISTPSVPIELKLEKRIAS